MGSKGREDHGQLIRRCYNDLIRTAVIAQNWPPRARSVIISGPHMTDQNLTRALFMKPPLFISVYL